MSFFTLDQKKAEFLVGQTVDSRDFPFLCGIVLFYHTIHVNGNISTIKFVSLEYILY